MDAEMKEMFDLLISEMGSMKSEMQVMNQKIDDNHKEIIKTQVMIEGRIEPRIDALYEGLQGTHEKEYQTGQKVERLEKDAGELKIRVDALESKVG